MDNAQQNILASMLAAGRSKTDRGLRYALGGGMGLRCKQNRGVLLLRRWTGNKYPQPFCPAVVGHALRPATTVSERAGAGHSPNTVYWYRVDIVSPGGIVALTAPEQIKCAVWDNSGWVGAIPNLPLNLVARQVAGPKVALSWLYNRASQQDAPQRFDIFSDAGTGTMDWSTIVASVNYVAGRELYAWTSGVLDGGPRLYNLRARTAAGVYSLVPKVADKVIGPDKDYSPVGGKNGIGVLVLTTPPATPPAPRF